MAKQTRPQRWAFDRIERDAEAVGLRRSGATYEEIATRLGLANKSVAYKMVQRGLARWHGPPAEELRALELERLEQVGARLWPLIDCEAPDLQALGAYLRVADQRARLAGLYAPSRQLVGVEVRAELIDRKLDALHELDAIIDARVAKDRVEAGGGGVAE
jgi:hypothetical protein